MKQLPVYILAGGKSSRFGSDKARVVIEGKPSIARVAEWAAPFASTLTVVADTPRKFDDLKLRTIADSIGPHEGPLGGILTALQDCSSDWLLLLACDMLMLHPAWIDQLLEHRANDAQAVAFKGEFWQPFPSLLHRTALDAITTARAHDPASVQKLYDRMNVVAMDQPPDWPHQHQFNSPADLMG